MELREGETVGEYITRLEARVKELEPPEGFTAQEWHIGQVYAYLMWMDDATRKGNAEGTRKWLERLAMFEERFPEQLKKFRTYMGWDEDTAAPETPK